jgi:hypothetical protein
MLYRAFGLEIASEVELDGVSPADMGAAATVSIHAGPIPDRGQSTLFYETPVHDADGSVTLRVHTHSDGSFHFAYEDGTVFLIDHSGSEIWMQWPENFTVQDAATYLLGPIFGFLLRLRGIVSLHASGVIIEDHAVALVGPAGAGKSTTVAAFAQCGYPVVTDDIFALNERGGRFFVEPGYATVRLWPDSVDALCGSPQALPLITPNWDKRYLDLRSGDFQFANSSTPISAIYVLGERRRDSAAPEIGAEPEAFLTLLANTYCNYLLDSRARAHEFDVLSRLVNSTTVRRITPHCDASRLPELCQMIADDVRLRVSSAAF